MGIIEKGKVTVEKVTLFLKWSIPLLFIILSVLFLIRLVGYIWFSDDIITSFKNNPELMVGLPLAGVSSLALVLALEQKESKVKFKGLGFDLEGMAGQLFLWVICFVSIVGAIKLLTPA